ncbi:MAG: hypothetical protein ACE5G8_06390, partial [Anaerolineae bacterium]
ELARQTLTLSSEEAADLAGWLHRHTGGNPFLTVETLHNLRRSSLAPPYRTHRLEQLPLPDLVQRHLQNRLERLPPSSRRALLAASVIGRPFTFRLLETLTHLDADALLEYLESWLARGLLVEESTGCYNFATPCLQRAAYNSLSRPRRRQSHYRLARALENTPPVDAGLVAHHYRLAGHPQQA